MKRRTIASGFLLVFLTTSFLAYAAVASAELGTLQGTWQLVEFRSSSDTVGIKKPVETSEFEMTIFDDGRVTMTLGCNKASGTWQAEAGPSGESGQFTFGPLAGTRALCQPPRLDELVTAQSQFVRGFLLKDNMLHLSLMADGEMFSWQRVSGSPSVKFSYQSPEDGGPRNWRVDAGTTGLNLRAKASADARVIHAYPTGTILDNLGCQVSDQRTWCDVQELGGGSRGYVAADFIEPAMSPNGYAMFGPDESALRAGQGKFDSTGTIPCAETEGQPAMPCSFGVARSGGGYATVVVTKPSGGDRIIYFRMGRVIGAGTSEVDNPGAFSSSRDADLYLVRLGSERFEIPDAVVLGG